MKQSGHASCLPLDEIQPSDLPGHGIALARSGDAGFRGTAGGGDRISRRRRTNPTSARPGRAPASEKGLPMNLFVSIGPLVALIAGILILIVPRLLNYIVAIYLIVIGLLGLFGGRLLA